MASKYAFGQGLKELRFLFCQTSEHSAATRYVLTTTTTTGACAYEWLSWHDDIVALLADSMYRNFLTRSYPTMKKHNPHTPILIREANGTEPTLYARFGALHTDGRCRLGLMIAYRLWQGEKVAAERPGRQGDRTTSHRAGTIEDIRQVATRLRRRCRESKQIILRQSENIGPRPCIFVL
jgi:hypothetical protein